MRIVRGGRAFYGQPIGVLMADAVVPRLPGDIGNAFTFEFPVRYRVVPGATWDRFASADPTLLAPFLAGAKELEAEGFGRKRGGQRNRSLPVWRAATSIQEVWEWAVDAPSR